MEDSNNIILDNEFAIVVYGKDEEHRKTLAGLIKGLLEQNYVFRTIFANSKVIIDDIDINNVKNNLVENNNSNTSNNSDQIKEENKTDDKV